jgi:hypothetical protein
MEAEKNEQKESESIFGHEVSFIGVDCGTLRLRHRDSR